MLKGIRISTAVIMLLSFLSFGTNALAGWEIEEKKEMSSMGTTMKSIIIVGEKAIRVDTPEMKTSVILDITSGKMYAIVHFNKVYMEMEIEQMNKIISQFIDQTKAKARLPKIEMKRPGVKRDIDGFKCEKLIFLVAGKERSEVWVSVSIKDPNLIDAYKSLFKLAASSGSAPNAYRIEVMQQALDVGFPIKVVHKNDYGQKDIKKVISMKKTKTDPDVFKPPAKYQKKIMPQAPGTSPQAPGGPSSPGAPNTPPVPPAPPQPN